MTLEAVSDCRPLYGRVGGEIVALIEGGTFRVQLFHRALEHGISITPGAIFSLSEKYRNYIRLSSAFWDERAERGIETLGRLVKDAH